MGHHHDEAEEEQVPFRLEGAAGSGHHIVVTAVKRQWLNEHLERQWRRPPTADESDSFLADYIREEVLYREALSLGLDRDDLVVRRRLVQKMEMLAVQDGPGMSESDMVDYYLDHGAKYMLPESVSFRHVFFSSATRGEDALGSAQTAVDEIRHGESSALVGDRPSTPHEVTDWTRSMVAYRFGADFAKLMFEIEPGEWSDPIASAYGYHIVLVSRREAARTPEFGEVADRVATDLDTERRAKALDRIYASVRDAYSVEIEPVADGGTSHHSQLHSHAERTP